MPNVKRDIPEVDLNSYIIEPETLKTIPEELARKHKMIPLFLIRNNLTIAISNPGDIIALDEARAASGYDIQAMKAEDEQILKVIDQYYNVSNSIEEIVSRLKETGIEYVGEEKLDLVKLQRIAEEPPVIKLVNLIIVQALKDKASDIHIEPLEDEIKVRLRIDGVLHTLITFPRTMGLPIVPRIKVIAGLNIVERRLPQDGRFRVRIEEREIDLRISSFPVAFGEKIVIRLLDRGMVSFSLDKLGFSPNNLEKFESMISKPYGIILVTGPTGSGKSSTLYAALTKLNSAEKNIITLEDPREYLLKGINQGEVNPEIGFTFANGLRSILRQDPDIIMVGEIRDSDTAQIAIRAALTGHLVLATLHTNDAASSITRLIDMQIEPFLIASSVIGVLAQRLVRVICSNCKEQYIADEGTYARLGLNQENRIPLYRGRGCILCRHTGYKGRIGIFESILIDDSLRQFINKSRNAIEIKEMALKSEMQTLRHDGYLKVLNGVTTIEEVLRVVNESE